MNTFKILLISVALTLPALASEALILKVAQKSTQVMGVVDLGNIQVAGIGSITLTARRLGNQLVVEAIDPEGKVNGRAESVTGASETPLAIMTPKGLETLIVMWGRE